MKREGLLREVDESDLMDTFINTNVYYILQFALGDYSPKISSYK